jgi:hypothetical protein
MIINGLPRKRAKLISDWRGEIRIMPALLRSGAIFCQHNVAESFYCKVGFVSGCELASSPFLTSFGKFNDFVLPDNPDYSRRRTSIDLTGKR